MNDFLFCFIYNIKKNVYKHASFTLNECEIAVKPKMQCVS